MKHIYLESSFLVALLLEDHINHKRANDILKKAVKLPSTLLLISTLTLDEIWWVLYQYSSKANRSIHNPFSSFALDFSKAVKYLLNYKMIKLLESFDPEQLVNTAIYGAERFNLRPRDSFHYAYVRQWRAYIISFDKDYNHTDLSILNL